MYIDAHISPMLSGLHNNYSEHIEQKGHSVGLTCPAQRSSRGPSLLDQRGGNEVQVAG